jgi:mono/diheme cytochrome c family protein
MTGIMKFVVVGLALLLGACGGSKSAGSRSTGKVSAIEAMGITPPDSPWQQMSVADKEFYMIGKVNPIMQELFAAHDAEEFADFDCVDCHGEEMREIDFKMPAPSMYIVPPEGTPGHRGMMSTFPETVKFMEETVTPTMGKLLGVESFTCAGCHPSEAPKKKKAATPKRKPSKTKG